MFVDGLALKSLRSKAASSGSWLLFEICALAVLGYVGSFAELEKQALADQ